MNTRNSKTHTVVAVFDSESKAQQAVNKLENKGYIQDSIDVTDYRNQYSSYEPKQQKSFMDRVENFFDNLFDDDDDKRTYNEVAKNGTLVTVYVDDYKYAQEVAEILDNNGALDAKNTYANYQNSNYQSTGAPTTRTNAEGTTVSTNYDGKSTTATMTGKESTTSQSQYRDAYQTTANLDTKADAAAQKIEVVEEELQVGKREVVTGGAKVRSRIVEKEVSEDLRLRKEYVDVDYKTVDRPATDAAFQEKTIEVTERAEVPVVNKEARVVSEVSVGKDVEHETRTISDTVRETKVEVEQKAAETRMGTKYDDDTRTNSKSKYSDDDDKKSW